MIRLLTLIALFFSVSVFAANNTPRAGDDAINFYVSSTLPGDFYVRCDGPKFRQSRCYQPSSSLTLFYTTSNWLSPSNGTYICGVFEGGCADQSITQTSQNADLGTSWNVIVTGTSAQDASITMTQH